MGNTLCCVESSSKNSIIWENSRKNQNFKQSTHAQHYCQLSNLKDSKSANNSVVVYGPYYTNCMMKKSNERFLGSKESINPSQSNFISESSVKAIAQKISDKTEENEAKSEESTDSTILNNSPKTLLNIDIEEPIITEKPSEECFETSSKIALEINHEQTNNDQKQEEESPTDADIQEHLQSQDPSNIIHNLLIEEAEKMVMSILDQTKSSYEGYDQIYQEKKGAHQLKIYMQSYTNQDKNRINKTCSEWYISFSPEKFIKLLNVIAEQQKLDTNMSDFKVIDNFNQTNDREYMIMYLAYKKILSSSSRDFVYLKHCRKLNEFAWCDVSKSITYQSIPEYEDKVRGQIILSGHTATIEINPTNGKTMTKIRLYSECDFKTNVPLFIAKTFAIDHTRKYVEKSIARLTELYPMEINQKIIQPLKFFTIDICNNFVINVNVMLS